MKKIIILALLLSNVCFAGTVVLTPSNTVTFRGEVNYSSVAKAQIELAALNKQRGDKKYPIYLVLDSPGGSIQAGEDFIEFAKTFKNVKTVSLFAASMASAIAQALPGERLITKSGVMMFHRAAGTFQGQFEDGEIESQLAFWKDTVKSLEQRNADRMELSLSEYKKEVIHELWLRGQKVVDKKAADRVVTVQCSNELIEGTEDVLTASFFGVSKDTFSKCPLIIGALPTKE
jgi:ATP-dependent protease ClpP protease subunit